MKENEAKTTMIEVSIDDWNEMKADCMAMKLRLKEMACDMDDKKSALAATEKHLKAMVTANRDLREQLQTALQGRQEAEQSAEACIATLSQFLMRWLSKANQAHAEQMLRFYFPQDKVQMMSALLTYLIFGRRTHFAREVEKTHFKLICDRIDEDAVTLPAHSMMVTLMQKYGLFEALEHQK